MKRAVQMVSVVFAAIFSLVYIIISFIKQRFMFFPVRISYTAPMYLPPEFSYTRVKCLGDDELAVFYRREPDMSLPFVLFCHGTMCVQEFDVALMTDTLPHCNLIAYDYRGYGRSDGLPSEYACTLDLLYLIAWIKHTFPTIDIRHDLILWGRSIGTNVVLQFVGNLARQDIVPNRIFLYTPFTRLSDVLGNLNFPAPFLAYLVGNMDVVQSLKTYCAHDMSRRVLIMGSQHDTVTPWACCEELARAVPLDQVTLRKFIGLHSGQFMQWNIFNEFVAATTRERIDQDVTEADIYKCIAQMFAEEK